MNKLFESVDALFSGNFALLKEDTLPKPKDEKQKRVFDDISDLTYILGNGLNWESYYDTSNYEDDFPEVTITLDVSRDSYSDDVDYDPDGENISKERYNQLLSNFKEVETFGREKGYDISGSYNASDPSMPDILEVTVIQGGDVFEFKIGGEQVLASDAYKFLNNESENIKDKKRQERVKALRESILNRKGLEEDYEIKKDPEKIKAAFSSFAKKVDNLALSTFDKEFDTALCKLVKLYTVDDKEFNDSIDNLMGAFNFEHDTALGRFNVDGLSCEVYAPSSYDYGNDKIYYDTVSEVISNNGSTFAVSVDYPRYGSDDNGIVIGDVDSLRSLWDIDVDTRIDKMYQILKNKDEIYSNTEKIFKNVRSTIVDEARSIGDAKRADIATKQSEYSKATSMESVSFRKRPSHVVLVESSKDSNIKESIKRMNAKKGLKESKVEKLSKLGKKLVESSNPVKKDL